MLLQSAKDGSLAKALTVLFSVALLTLREWDPRGGGGYSNWEP